MKQTLCFLLIFLLVMGCLRRPETAGLKPTPLPDKKDTLHETYVYGQTHFASGSPAALRVMVKGATSLTGSVALPGATVKISLKEKDKTTLLYEGKTNDAGEAPVRFSLPDLAPGKYSLLISTSSPYGKEEVSQKIQVSRKEKILLVTDKPIYQPNQTIHIRALCLNEITLKPAAKKSLLLEVEDSKGNKVFKKRIKTGDYGIGPATFTLADEVNMGAYKIRALIGKEKTEKTVTVKKYVLPKFKVVLSTEKEYYLPGEKVKGKIRSDYFFGKAVSGGKVKI